MSILKIRLSVVVQDGVRVTWLSVLEGRETCDFWRCVVRDVGILLRLVEVEVEAPVEWPRGWQLHPPRLGCNVIFKR